jgi:hypothetical protein
MTMSQAEPSFYNATIMRSVGHGFSKAKRSASGRDGDGLAKLLPWHR